MTPLGPTPTLIPPVLPPELWLHILSRIDNPTFLWRTCRLISRAAHTGTLSLFRSYWIPRRMMLSHCNPSPKRGCLSHHSADGRIAYFALARQSMGPLFVAKGLFFEGKTWLYVVVRRQDAKKGTVVVYVSANRSEVQLEYVRVECEYGEGGIGAETRVHVDRKKKLVGIDWRGLMSVLLSR